MCHIEVIVLNIGQVMTRGVPFAHIEVVAHLQGLQPLLEVEERQVVVVVQLHDGLVGVGELGPREGTQFAVGRQRLAGEKQLFSAVVGIDGPGAVGSQLHRCVAPPHDSAVLGNHVAVVRAAEVQVLEGELLLRCRHKAKGECEDDECEFACHS